MVEKYGQIEEEVQNQENAKKILKIWEMLENLENV